MKKHQIISSVMKEEYMKTAFLEKEPIVAEIEKIKGCDKETAANLYDKFLLHDDIDPYDFQMIRKYVKSGEYSEAADWILKTMQWLK